MKNKKQLAISEVGLFWISYLGADLERCDLEIQQLKDNTHWLAAMGHADWYVEKLLIKNELNQNQPLAIPCPQPVKEI